MFAHIRLLMCLSRSRNFNMLDHLHFFEPLEPTDDSSSKETFMGNTNPGGTYKWNLSSTLGEPFPDDYTDFPVIWGQKRGDKQNSAGVGQ
mmetsp:Transcript_42899/g.87746  ORF Transcript_42899/g.87746 Transcript_42899/m.87746 type:complete len:90 (-) Transcript_42899:512-781(-)|eukprot:CAMPEP_0181300596 /NCGR_PEP_ID=MMETSP1101-20121128/6973_1 /TAXON_ID=46948 /ORGANISM="Rhodomonas abbreviata, Strain Caron Lab Isolate" /LENGTH=89 /DNA_ID=CAMNT_0023405841 /DNA_START=133 /DNA_END=402 /DNA_ORIENTATION=-